MKTWTHNGNKGHGVPLSHSLAFISNSLICKKMKLLKFIVLLVCATIISPISASAQDKSEIVTNYVAAFNSRDVEKYLEPLDDSIIEYVFPNEILYNGKEEMRKAYTSAFKAAELGGKIEILGASKIGDVYVIEQSLVGNGPDSIDQFVVFKFSKDKIVEIHYLPKNFEWKNAYER